MTEQVSDLKMWLYVKGWEYWSVSVGGFSGFRLHGLTGGECPVQDIMHLHFDISIVHFNGWVTLVTLW